MILEQISNIIQNANTLPRKPEKKLVKGMDYNTLAAAIERIGGGKSGPIYSPNRQPILSARVATVENVGVYTIKLYKDSSYGLGGFAPTRDQVRNDLGQIWDSAQGYMRVKQEVNENRNLLKKDDEVTVSYIGAPGGIPVYEFVGFPAAGRPIRIAALTKDGGDGGSDGVYPSFTYTFDKPDTDPAIQITDQSPMYREWAIEHSEAHNGIIVQNDAGDWLLVIAFETGHIATCSAEPAFGF